MDSNKICDIARMVINIEGDTIKNLIDRIDEQFVKACQYLSLCGGRIVVMGVGKSGHIAKKIAATFASTGSPAFFIHPSEAKHGDIGMITSKDVLLVLSYSGETEELLSILPAIKRLDIPLIALTGNPGSRLAKAAMIHLNVGVLKEACPLGLAPTSSSTAALVMGDALAMALLDHRGFTKNDFALSHPGGNLGRRLLLLVDEIMHQGDAIPIVLQSASLKEALVEMTQKKLGMTAVIDATNKLVGVFTDGDVRRALDENIDIHQTIILDLMSKCPKTISATLLAADALEIMETFKITTLIAVNAEDHPIGVLHIHDILRAGVSSC